ncbi:CAP domain-containing protein [Salsuginibacillus kocurii]|uniref:CAP domain-containing protein n=1 Tax=Salsuginibacillus kocurii TaxID=427078 RepID=UPI00035C73BC|nr:CAP domain-containing protein [Salsuginibacillus kocurii]
MLKQAFLVFFFVFVLLISLFWVYLYFTPVGEEQSDDPLGEIGETNEEKEAEEEAEEEEPVEQDHVEEPEEGSEAANHNWVGKEVEEYQELHGEPIRSGPSAYDYDWQMYHLDEGYTGIGVSNGTIVMVANMGESIQDEEVRAGMSREEIESAYTFSEDVDVEVDQRQYTFHIEDEAYSIRPLAEIDNIFVQAYFDTVQNELVAIRYLTAELLLDHRPYSVTYQGALPERPSHTRQEWQAIENSSKYRVHDWNNGIRDHYELPSLEWDDNAAAAAFSHSEQMAVEGFFSHTAPDGTDLGERLEAHGATYTAAGENLASQYTDSLAAVVGWLNSEGHRENVLHEEFTHHGAGVYERYFTQNFIVPLEEHP